MIDKVSSDLFELLSTSPHGEVVDYKINDGTDIGLILKLNTGELIWLFADEIQSMKSQLIEGSEIITISNYQYEKRYKKLTLKKDLSYVLNPLRFLEWLTISLKDVY
ncbi:hypothetical protein EV06_0894 [Prochlorococcus sp. MIT 0602]|nr:hypothetical protein EV06_0894 [Prochlorococcus sp. MIT 0602]KGG17303.1 hypothetical protein EV07_0741 [Prochlorococcus sp. MIT 0603]